MDVLLYIAAFMAAGWGASHLLPTRAVVDGFGEISRDSRLVITMEWLVEGVALIFIGALVTVVTAVDSESDAATATYLVTAGGLLTLAAVSLFTGFRVNFLPYRLCPVIFTGSAALIVIGALG